MSKLNRYIQLINDKPHHFINNNLLNTIIIDRSIIEKYMYNHNVEIGVLYESNYHIVVVDLVIDQNGQYHTYERLISEDNPVIIIPKYQEKYVLLKQYRHSLRDYQYSFPRGFGEEGVSAYENALKELQEEIGANINNIEELHSIVANSGIEGNIIHVFVAEIDDYKLNAGYEGIKEILLVDEVRLKEMINAGDINDSMSLAAYQLYLFK